jgi:uncharacterized membrane protein
MNLAHLHLLTNHLPVFFTAAGSIVLLIGYIKRDQTTILSAIILFIIAAIGAIVAFCTGESAAEAVERIQDVSHDMIEEHEEIADKTLVSFIILGVYSIITWLLINLKPQLSKKLISVLLFFSIVSFGVAARTAFIGGKIRHSEVRGETQISAEQQLSELEEAKE